MLISNIHKSIIVMNSLDTRFSRNVFEAIQKTRRLCFNVFKCNLKELSTKSSNSTRGQRSVWKRMYNSVASIWYLESSGFLVSGWVPGETGDIEKNFKVFDWPFCNSFHCFTAEI